MHQQKTTTANDQLNSSQHPETSPHIFLQIVQSPSTAFVAQQRQHIHTKQKPHGWHVLRPSQQNQFTKQSRQQLDGSQQRIDPNNNGKAKRFQYHPNILSSALHPKGTFQIVPFAVGVLQQDA